MEWKKENYVIILSWNFYEEIIEYLKNKKYEGLVLKPFPKIIETKI